VNSKFAILVTCVCMDGARAQKADLKVQVGHSSGITGVAYLPSMTQVLTASTDGTARLWDIATGSEVRTFENQFPISSMALSSKGNWLITGGVTTQLWDVNTAKRIRAFGAGTSSVAFSPDDRLVLAGGGDTDGGTVTIWNAESGKEIQRFVGHSKVISCAQFLPGGHQIITGAFDDTVRLWDVSSGKEIRRYETRGSLKVALSSDGRRMLTGGFGPIARLWDVASGNEMANFRGNWKSILGLAFSPDGKKSFDCRGGWRRTRALGFDEP